MNNNDSRDQAASVIELNGVVEGLPECELTILMPCLNEAETIAGCVDQAQDYLKRSGIDGEVLVSDNGSTDGSQAIADAHGARVIDVSHRGGGYGSGLMGGILSARGRFVIMGDSDGSYDFSDLDGFVRKLREGADLVMGNRFQGGIKEGAMPFLHKHLGNPVLTWFGQLFFGSPVGDFNCGLRGMRKTAIANLGLLTIGMEFASEMVVKSTFRGLKIEEVPTTLSPDGRSRPPHLKSWRDGWRVLRFLLLYSPRWLFLLPGLALVAAGLLTMAIVLPGPLLLGSVVFDVHTLVVAMGAILVGSQMALFFLLAKQYAGNEGLLPESERFSDYRRWVSLEKSIVVGLIFIVLGTVLLGWAVFLWAGADFGDLDYSWMMRLVIPSVTMIALGFQIMFAGFFSSILDIRHNRA
jgi:glycosyltransferase involved in cell wall biosynthesis